jgi:two-component system cell cycle response regulator CtrA
MRLLLIDQDRSMAEGVCFMLKESGVLSDYGMTGEEGFELSRLYEYDIILMDLALQDMYGLEALYKFRSAGIKTPVMMMASLNDLDTKVEALNLGADDFILKPFHIREIIARSQAIVRRSQGHSVSNIQVGRLKIDLRRNVAEVGGKLLDLTSKEYSILKLMAIRKGVMISKDMFLNHLYAGVNEPVNKIVDVFICRLRKKLAEATGGSNFVQTVWGRGYILRDPEHCKFPAPASYRALKTG